MTALVGFGVTYLGMAFQRVAARRMCPTPLGKSGSRDARRDVPADPPARVNASPGAPCCRVKVPCRLAAVNEFSFLLWHLTKLRTYTPEMLIYLRGIIDLKQI